MKPLLSIVIPNYNNSRFLDDCLGGIVRQTYRPLEVVVVDDCSTDDSKEKITEYAKSYPWLKGVFLEKNGGVSHARNIGAAEATGEYLTFLDADDYYINSEKLENEMELLLTAKEQNVAAFSQLQAVDTDGRPLWNYHTEDTFDEKGLKRALLSERALQLPRDYCYRRSFFRETGGYAEGKSLYEDTAFLLKLSEKCSFVCTGSLGSAYRISGQGLSSVAKEKHKKAKQELYREFRGSLSGTERVIIFMEREKNRGISLAKEICKDILNLLGIRKKRVWE